MINQRQKNVLFSIVLIIFLGSLIYSNSLKGEFQFDDHSFIVNNLAIQNLYNIKSIWTAYYYPTRFVSFLSFAGNFHLTQLDVFSYHIVNLIIHLCNALLVYWLFILLSSTAYFKNDLLKQNQLIGALFCALLFLTHPLQTQAVSYITQRFASLATFFYLLTVCCYIRGRRKEGTRKQRNIFYWVAVVSALLGAFTKEIVITLPLMLLLVEKCFLFESSKGDKTQERFWLKVLPFFFISILIPLMFQFNFKGILLKQVSSGSHGTGTEIVSSGVYLLTQFRVIITYVWLLICPVNQNFDYDFPLSKSLFEVDTFLSLLGLIAILLIALKLYPRRRIISFGVFWFFIALLVESSILPIAHVIFEHRTYLPSVGFMFVTSAGLMYVIKNKRIYIALMSAVVLVLSFMTFQRNEIWQDEVSFWKDTIKKSPLKSRPYDNLASAYLRKGEVSLAITNLIKALSLDDDNPETYSNLGEAYLKLGNTQMAQQYLEKALIFKTKTPAVLNNLGLIHMSKGENDIARGYFQKALQNKTRYLEPLFNLAKIEVQEGSMDRAASIYQAILERFPNEHRTLKNLLFFHLDQKQYEQARALQQRLLSTFKNEEDLVNIGSYYAKSNFNNIALLFFLKAQKINSAYAPTYLEMGKLFGNQEDFTRAIEIWQNGQKVDPKNLQFEELIRQAQQLQEN